MSARASYAGISDVGQLLLDHLAAGVTPRASVTDEQIALASPDDAGSRTRITLFLYRVTENDHLRNERRAPRDPATRSEESTVRAEGSPLVLTLHYLLTTHPDGGGGSNTGGDPTGQTADQHELLGLAMQTFHDDSILRGADLPATLASRDLQVSVESQSIEELSNIWSLFAEDTYHTSVAYSVTPVVVESAESSDSKRVLDRSVEEYV